MANIFRGKNILVTGGTGSIGGEIVRKVLQNEPQVVRVFGNDEDGQFNLGQKLQGYSNVRFLIGDVKDKERLKMAIENMDFVFHAAALKHVPLGEYNPFEAVKTNVLGTQNVIEVAMEEKIEKLITISTDKAVNVVNVLGATKLLAERLTISADYYKGDKKTVFSCVRFGNVLHSRGSVVPLFRQQIENGGPVTLTDPEMTRFIMPITRAVELLLKATEMAESGEIYILKMPALRIGDLAEVMIEELASQYGYSPDSIERRIIGRRIGEKNYEELLTEDEAVNAREVGDMFIISPLLRNEGKTTIQGTLIDRQSAVKNYTSKDQSPLTKKEIKALLK